MNSFNDPNSWVITVEDRLKNDTQFYSLNPVAGFLSGEQAKFFFLQSGLANQILGRIWNLSDLNIDGKMDKNEFSIAMFLIKRCLKGQDVPNILPPSLISSPQSSMLANNLESSSSPPQPSLYNTMPYQNNTNTKAPRQLYSTTSRGSITSNDWVITPAQRLKYKQVFDHHQKSGYLTGSEARKLLSGSGLTHPVLAQIWCLADIDADGNLSSDEFCVAMHLIDQAKSGFPLPVTLPQDLIPPTQRKLRRASEVNTANISVAVSTANNIAVNNGIPVLPSGMYASSGVMMPVLNQTPGVMPSESPNEQESTRIVTFEDKRKENFNQGQAELEKRRAMLRESQIQDSEARLTAERIEHEKKEKIRMEQEMVKQHEFERQLERQRQIELEKEEERKRIFDQKEAARQEMNRQRQADWQKQRQEQLLAERSKCQAAVDQLKQQTGQQRQSLENWREKKKDTMSKVEATRQSLTDISSTIDSIKLLSLSKSTEIDVIASELEEVEMKMVAVEQESLRLKKHIDSSEDHMNDAWRELKRERDRKEEGMQEKRKKLEILRESCAKKEEMIRKREEEVKKQTKNLPAVTDQKPKYDSLFGSMDMTSSQGAWKGPSTISAKNWENLNTEPETSLKDDEWAVTSTHHEPKVSWTADFKTNLENKPVPDATLKTKYKALYNFDARTDDELSLVEGDIVMVHTSVRTSSEPGWMIGSKGGHIGCFPEAYVSRVDEMTVVDTKTNDPNLPQTDEKIVKPTGVGGDNKDVFSTLSKVFEEAFSTKKSPTKDLFSKAEDESSTQPFQALNDVFTSAFSSTNKKDQSSNFNTDFSNFDQSNFDVAIIEPSPFKDTNDVSNRMTNDISNDSSNTTHLEVNNLTTHQQVNNLTSQITTKKASNIDCAIKDILEKSRRTPVSPIPFASAGINKVNNPSPLTTSTSKTATINAAIRQPSTLSNNILPSTLSTTKTISFPTITTTTKPGAITEVINIFETTTSATNNTLINNVFNNSSPKEDITTLETKTTTDFKIPASTKQNTKNITTTNTTTNITTTNTTTTNTTNITPTNAITSVVVEAVYAWHAKKSNHLSFSKGDFINKLSEKSAWCYGEFNGKTGWFPKSYVKVIGSSGSPYPDLPPEVKPMSHDVNTNGNHVIKNAPSTPPINQSDASNDNLSVFSMANSRAAFGDSNNKESSKNEEIIVVAMFNYESEVSGDLTFKKGQVFVAQKTDIEWWTGSTDDGRVGIFPSSYVRKVETMTSVKLSDKRPEIATAIADYEATGPEQLSLKVDQLVNVRKKSQSGWWEGEIQVKGQKRRVGWFPANYVKLLGDEVNSVSSLENSTPTSTLKKAGVTTVVALYTYGGQTDGDLSFVEGDKIRVTQKCSDDWWEGELNGKLGIFPANYVAIDESDNKS